MAHESTQGASRGPFDGQRQPDREPGAAHYSLDYLRRRCHEAVAHWMAVGNAHLGRAGERRIAIPPVNFDLAGHTGGMVRYHRVRGKVVVRDLRLNDDLLRRYPVEMVRQTVPHEVAHVLVAGHYDSEKPPHGEAWQSIMRAFGKEPTVTHRMQTQAARRTRKFAVRCGCRTYEVGVQRYRRILDGVKYCCRSCRQALVIDSGVARYIER